MRKVFLSVVVVLVAMVGVAQPRIDNVERISGFPFSTVQITGTGFSSTSSDLQVWFGSVRGTIVTSTESSITATVPASARLSHVEVINTVTRRSAKSSKKFMPVYSGDSFTNNFTATAFTNADDIFDLCSCDFDGDGKPDIAGSKFRDGKTDIMMLRNTSTVSANNTTTSFVQTSITLAFPSFSVNCGDINGDGKPDLVASRGGTSTGNSIFVFQNTSTVGNITFAAPVKLDIIIGNFAKEIAIRDLNGDGRPEIVVTNGQTNIIYIFENKLTTATIVAGEFTRVDRTITGAVSDDGTLSLEIADFNGDGWPEIIVSPNANAVRVYILTNPGDGTLAFSTVTSITINGAQNINDIALADFDNNGSIDFVVADRSASGGKALVYLNRGGLVFQSVNGSTGFLASTAWGVDVADMNGDGEVDFVIGNRDFANPQVSIFINDGAANPGFAKETLDSDKANWFVKAGDFDGDSKPDIAVTSTNNNDSFSIDVWKNKNCHQTVILNENPLTICSPQNITLQAIPLQGLTFSWDHPTTGITAGPTRVVTVADAGTVTLTTVGEDGECSTQDVITISVGGPVVPAAPTITAPDGACAGNSITLSTPTAADEYEWSGPNNFTSTVQNPPAITNVTAANAGLYRLRVKSGGCFSDFAEKQIDVVAPQSFTIVGVGGNGVCEGQSVTLEITPSTTEYNFLWKQETPQETTIVGSNDYQYPIGGVAEANQGSYTVELSHKTISCTSTTPAFVLNVFSAPVASFTRTPTLVCVGTQVTFDASGSTVDNTAPAPTYAWNFGDASNGTGVSAAHTYASAQASVSVSLTVSYPGVVGCSNVSTPAAFNVESATAVVIAADPAVTEICSDGTEQVTLAITGSFTDIDWSNGGTNSSIVITGPGIYSVATVDANGCIGNDDIELFSKTGCEAGSASIPKVFTPNGDLANDFWVITSVPNLNECTMNVFDGRGRRVYEATGFPASGWDGISNGSPVPSGTYYYVLGCPGATPVTGSVLIVR